MQHLYLKPVTDEEISNIYPPLKSSAIGWDEIPMELLKLLNCNIV